MRIAYFSDIHIERHCHETYIFTDWTRTYPLHGGPDLSSVVGNVDLVIMAGDISSGDASSTIFSLKYASQVADFVGASVIFAPGNHEYDGGVFEKRRDALLSAHLGAVTVLDRNVATLQIGGVALRILGATFWTDYMLLGNPGQAMKLAAVRLNDHRLISTISGTPFMPTDVLREHLKSRTWLIERLTEKHDGPTIIVTHHVPHPIARNPRFPPADDMSPAFVSDCSDVIDAARAAGVRHWVFGHHHYTIDIDFNGVRLLSAQLGYPREITGWSGVPVFEI